jgi:hypothetical protein
MSDQYYRNLLRQTLAYASLSGSVRGLLKAADEMKARGYEITADTVLGILGPALDAAEALAEKNPSTPEIEEEKTA